MNAVIPNPMQSAEQVSERSFVDQHISKVAFLVSTIVQFVFGPLTLMLGSILGVVYSVKYDPNPTFTVDDQIITASSASFAMVGAFASILQITPAGASGGFIFQMVPYLSAFTIGTGGYRAFKWLVAEKARNP